VIVGHWAESEGFVTQCFAGSAGATLNGGRNLCIFAMRALRESQWLIASGNFEMGATRTVGI
jgi:hypothetical protein